MNIIVYSCDSKDFFFKPDNTLVRDSKDFFPPEYITEMSITLAFVVKISRSCKYTSREYAQRYYNEWGVGVLINPQILSDPANSLCSNTGKVSGIDNTAYITNSLHGIEELMTEYPVELKIDDKTRHFCNISSKIISVTDNAIENITRYASIKSGDLIYLPISDKILIDIGNNINVTYSGDSCFNFNIR